MARLGRPCIVVFLVVTLSDCCISQDVVRPGDLAARLKTVASWSPSVDLAAANRELTPTDVVALRDGTQRLLVATLGGTIRVVDADGMMLDAPLLTSAQVGLQLQQESGMTGIAIHPNFAGDRESFGYGKLYTITTENSSQSGGVPSARVDFGFTGAVHQDVIREWDLSQIVGNPRRNTLSTSVEDSREILRVDQPGPFHNLFDLAFDLSAGRGDSNYGQLFITSGDGGDSRTNAASGVTRRLASQDLSQVYGKLLRINPDPNAHPLVRTSANSGQPAYSVTSDNPFAGDDVLEQTTEGTLAEIFATGLRSPFRIGIDVEEGHILISDVGERQREEISLIEHAGNYGWGRFEGTRQDNDFVELMGPSPHTAPLFEYGRDIGSSAIGGTVYRGQSFPQLRGKYVFADFGQRMESARLFYGGIDPGAPDYGEIFEFDLSRSRAEFPVSVDEDATIDRLDSPLPDRIFGIGEDEDGELLLVAGQDPRALVDSVEGAFLVRLTRGIGCDLDGDAVCSLVDLDRVTLGIPVGATLADVNWDGAVDSSDVDAWRIQAGAEHGMVYLPGDVNLDGSVNFEDFVTFGNHFGVSDTAWSQGNFDGVDGTTFRDFILLAGHFNMTAAEVPEPSGICLAVALLVLVGARVRR